MPNTDAAPPPNRLRQLLAERGVRVLDLAVELGCDPSTVYAWARGSSQIPDERKRQLAERFEVTISYLMRWDDEPAASGAQEAAA